MFSGVLPVNIARELRVANVIDIDTSYVSVAFFVRAGLVNTNIIVTNSAQYLHRNLVKIWELCESDPLGKQLPLSVFLNTN